MENKKLLYYVQCLRGLASLLVCGFHTRYWINLNDSSKLGDFLFAKGLYGVELFFIISGFIMIYTTKDNFLQSQYKYSKLFIKKRIIRIAPLYTILTIVWYIIFIDSFNWNVFIKIIKSIMFIPYNEFPILYLGWSLNYEMFFYLIFAISLLFGHYKYIVLLVFFMIFISLQHFKYQNSYMNMISSFQLNYFLVGVLLGLFRKKIIINNSQISLTLFTVSMFILILFLFNYIKINNKISLLLFFTFIVYSVINFDFSQIKINLNALYFLGNISYSLYLFHPFIPNLLKEHFDIFPGIFKIDLLNYFFYILMMLSIILFSYILYHLIEKKLSNELKNFLKLR